MLTAQLFKNTSPLGYAGGDTNLYRYVGNNPTNLIDPTGLSGIELRGYVAQQAPSIDPTAQTNLAGSNWRWFFQPGDLGAIAQRVTLEGTFTAVDDCGLVQQVRWKESFTEVWTRGGTHRENHRTRPKKPAEYIEDQSGGKFQPQGKKLFFKGREVEGWTFTMEAKFEAVNGAYAGMADGGFYTSRNNFEITNLTLDNKNVAPGASNVFNRMLYPAGRVENIGFPPDQVLGKTVVATDTWSITWSKGQPKPSSTYKTSGYH